MLPAFFRAIGSDACLTQDELPLTTATDAHAAAAWAVYQRHFRGFTGATLDPLFHRLTHPAMHTGDIHLRDDDTVVVVGTGPSLARQIETLRRVRHHVRIFTSPRGAEALLTHGITPDLVLVEHQTALDAHHSARHVDDAGRNMLAECPLVAADWRTPGAMLARLDSDRLFVPADMPTWGLWPATALAMAVEQGAPRLALLGIDLGTFERPDPTHDPLRALLELLASLVPATTVDCGDGGAHKRGWQPARLAEVGGRQTKGRLDTRLVPAPRVAERVHDAGAALTQLAPVIARAVHLRDVALQARANRDVPTSALQDGMNEILTWGQDQRLRVGLQQSVGISFLPRFWRIGVDRSLGPALWRPLLLATHELATQADALRAIVARRGPADRAA